jgi:hypothetical protein
MSVCEWDRLSKGPGPAIPKVGLEHPRTPQQDRRSVVRPGQAEPSRAEPSRAEPSHAGPGQARPGQVAGARFRLIALDIPATFGRRIGMGSVRCAGAMHVRVVGIRKRPLARSGRAARDKWHISSSMATYCGGAAQGDSGGAEGMRCSTESMRRRVLGHRNRVAFHLPTELLAQPGSSALEWYLCGGH